MEDEIIATVSIILLRAAMKLLKKRKVKRNCWTRPWITFLEFWTMLCVLHHVVVIFDKTSNCKNLKEVKSLKPFIKRELYKQMCENKIKSFNENSKMFLYRKNSN
jgi:hypothetical protein